MYAFPLIIMIGMAFQWNNNIDQSMDILLIYATIEYTRYYSFYWLYFTLNRVYF